MNITLDSQTQLLDHTLANHLNLHLSQAAPFESAPAVNTTQTDAPSRSSSAAQNAAPGSDAGLALYHLLARYVDLLESSDHGGWTLTEDNAVREAVAALSRAGWKLHIARGI